MGDAKMKGVCAMPLTAPSSTSDPRPGSMVRWWPWVLSGWLIVALAWTPASAMVNAPSLTAEALLFALAYNLVHFGAWAAVTPLLFRLCIRWPMTGGRAMRDALILLLAGAFIIPAITAVGSLIELIAQLLRGAVAPTLVAAPGRVASRILATSLFALPTYIAVLAIGQTLLWAKRAEAHAREAAGAEMRALRAELNPHFLFNTLGAIARLSHAAPDRAEAAIGTLARVLRASLSEGGPTQAIAEAIGEIEEHLALYRTLHGPIRFDRRVDDDLWTHPIPDRVLLPLVENAMTHGAMDKAGERWLALGVSRSGAQIVITLTNPVPPAARPSTGLGSGLEATRRLLTIHYGANVTLAAQRSGDCFHVQLTLPA